MLHRLFTVPFSFNVSLQFLLQLCIFGTFFGHGIVAWKLEKKWIPYLNIAGFSNSGANYLLPLIGTIDILLSIIQLFYPHPLIYIYTSVWAFSTAVMRPLNAESIWSTIYTAEISY